MVKLQENKKQDVVKPIERPYKLPEGWTGTFLGDVTQIVSGSTPKSKVQSFWGGDVAWIAPKELSGFKSKIVTKTERTLTKEGYDSCSTKLLPIGTVLLTSRAPIGYVAIAGIELCTNQG